MIFTFGFLSFICSTYNLNSTKISKSNLPRSLSANTTASPCTAEVEVDILLVSCQEKNIRYTN